MGYFLPYQSRWIADESPVKLYEKSRRIGVTYATSFRCVLKCLAKPQGTAFTQWVSSRDTLTAKEFVTDYVAKWAREANAVARELAAKAEGAVGLDGRNVEVVDEQRGITAFVVRFRNGARICSLSSNPMAFAGKGGDVLIDEMDLHEDQETLYAMAFPCITWGGQLEMVSAYSAAGSEDTLFARLCAEARDGNPRGYGFHRTTLDDAIAEGFVEKVNEAKAAAGRPSQTREGFRASIRGGCPSEDAFASQYLCVPNRARGDQAVPASDLQRAKADIPVLRRHFKGDAGPLDLADPCTAPFADPGLWKGLAEAGGWPQRCSSGWDIAVTGDLGCIWLNVTEGDVHRVVACLIFQGCRTESQRRVLEAILAALPSCVACGDATGLGTTECANLEVRHYGRFQGVKFNVQSKLEMWGAAAAAYAADRQKLPRQFPEISADVASIRRETSPGGRLVFAAGRNALLPDSHGDLATANALAIRADGTLEGGPCLFEAAGAGNEPPDGLSAWARSRRPDHSDDL